MCPRYAVPAALLLGAAAGWVADPLAADRFVTLFPAAARFAALIPAACAALGLAAVAAGLWGRRADRPLNSETDHVRE